MVNSKQPPLTSRQKGFRQNRSQFAAPIGSDMKLEDKSGTLLSPFLAILHHKGTEWKLTFLIDFFSLHIQNQK